MIRRFGVALGALLAAHPTAAQPTPWSPFLRGADLLDAPARPPSAEMLLTRPRGFGLLWETGNPAGAMRDLEGRAVDVLTGVGRAYGPWRRPLDAVTSVTPEVAARGWQPVGPRILGGSFQVGQDLRRPDGLSALGSPYASVPYVPSDTTTPDLRETAVRLEGLAAADLGRFAVGVTLGYDARDRRSSNTPLPRIGRSATPAASAGVIAHLANALRVGVSGRWSWTRENFRLAPAGAAGQVYELQGLGAYGPIDVAGGTGPYVRRLTTTRWEVGPELGGAAGAFDWIATGRLTRTDADHTSQIAEENPASDTWRARGSTLLAALRIRLSALTLEAHAGRAELSGDGALYDLEGTAYHADESRAWIEGTARIGTLADAWQGSLTVGTVREQLDRQDYLYRRHATIDSWTPGAAAALAFHVAAATWVGAEGGMATRYNSSAIPDPTGLEASYQALIGPALAWRAAQVVPWQAGLSLRQRVGAVALLLRGTYGQATAVSEPLPLQPGGDRRAWTVQLIIER